jgi:hypothetical protein
MSWRRLVREGVRDWSRRPVHTVTYSRSFASVNEQREQLVYHVVVQRSATTRLVGPPVKGCLLNLKEAVGGVWPRHVDDQVVGEQQFGQGALIDDDNKK